MRPFELRESGGNTATSDGYASLFNQSYAVGPVDETIAPGAFRNSLSRPDLDVVLRVEHRGLPLARTTSGTLKLNEDSTGLRARAQLDTRDPEVASLLVKYSRHDLNEMSFAFKCEQDEFGSSTFRVGLHPGGTGIEFPGDEVDHRDVVAVRAVAAGSALGCLDE